MRSRGHRGNSVAVVYAENYNKHYAVNFLLPGEYLHVDGSIEIRMDECLFRVEVKISILLGSVHTTSLFGTDVGIGEDI